MENNKEQVLIELSKIEPSPYNTFMNNKNGEDSDRIKDMIGSIKSLGLITPLSVIGPTSDGKYQILSGERRYHALKTLIEDEEYKSIYEKVACYIVGDANMNIHEQKLIIESANVETRDINKDEHILNIIDELSKMRDEGILTQKQITKEMDKYLSCSDRYKRMYSTIYEKATIKTKDMLKEHKLSVAEASKISTLPEKMQEDVAKAIESGEIEKKDALKAVSNVKNITKKAEEIEKKLINTNETGIIKQSFDNYDVQDDEYSNNDEDTNDYIDKKDDINWDEVDLDDIEDVEIYIEQVEKRKQNGSLIKEEMKKLNEKTNIDLVLGNDARRIFKESNDDANQRSKKNIEFITNWCNSALKKTHFTDDEAELAELLEITADTIKRIYNS